MADDRPVTPEKQLLKLIEDPSRSKDSRRSAGAPNLGSRRGPLLSFSALRGALMGRLSFFKRSTVKRSIPKKFTLSFTSVNRVLAASAFALAVYLVFDVVASAISYQKPMNITLKPEKSPGDGTKSVVSPLKESAYYLQKAASRDIFREGGAAPVQKEAQKAEPVSVENNPATSGLSLVGISWSSNPDVIIEDKNSKRTFFVKRGQSVGVGVKIEAIFKDRVILSHEGQEFELR